MNTFGVQYPDKSLKISLEKYDAPQHSNPEISEIKKVLRQFQDGYTKRDLSNVEGFAEELFIVGDDTCILGTGTGELFLGIEQVKTLIKNDWEYWGDVNIDSEDVYIGNKDEVAWFAAKGTVRYIFQNTPESYDKYINFIKHKAQEPELTDRQKITFINWVLSLTYHQRADKQREYLWPLRLSGVLLKNNDKWKFAQIQFSIPKSNFPDERFESSKEYIENYNNQNTIADKYLNSQMDIDIKSLVKGFETEIFGQKDISKELISKYFDINNIPFIIEPDNRWHMGADQIMEFFAASSGAALTLDLEHAVASKQSGVTWITACGLLKKSITEDELFAQILDEIENLLQSDIPSEDKLFSVHRSIAYALKESAAGQDYTCPVRLTAVVINQAGKPVFQHMHFSFPFYWVFEGKLYSV